VRRRRPSDASPTRPRPGARSARRGVVRSGPPTRATLEGVPMMSLFTLLRRRSSGKKVAHQLPLEHLADRLAPALAARSRKPSGRPLRGRSGARGKPCLEVLEDRTLPAAIIDLGTLGGTSSRALGINALGQVVGWSELASGAVHGFVYSDGQMTDVGTLGGGWQRRRRHQRPGPGGRLVPHRSSGVGKSDPRLFVQQRRHDRPEHPRADPPRGHQRRLRHQQPGAGGRGKFRPGLYVPQRGGGDVPP
jgi:probable HAF family extracellular repeat protein